MRPQLLAAAAHSARAEREAVAPRWIVLSLPGLRLSDLGDPSLPTLSDLTERGHVGLMNATTAAPFRADAAGASALASASLTLGSGRRASSPPPPPAGYEARELPPAFWRRLAERNPDLPAPLPAERLARAGARIGVVAAAAAEPGADALLAVTAPGVPVAAGSAGTRWLRRDPARPYGVAADLERMAAEAARLARDVDLLWLDTGDLSRALAYAPWCFPEVAAAHRRAALEAADRFLTLLQRRGLPRTHHLLVVSPTVAEGRFGLTPVLWAGAPNPPGLLSSGATRVPGLIANTDLMPHLLASLLPGGGSPSPLRAIPAPQPLATLQALESRSLRADRARAATMPVAKAWLLLGVVVAFSAITTGRRSLAGVARAWPFAVPLCALLLGAWVAGAYWLGAALLLAGVWVARSSPRARPGVLGTWLLAVLLLDLALGAELLRWSPLGYSLALGARYYGIGNEWMGYLVGAALLAALAPGRGVGRGVLGRASGVSRLASGVIDPHQSDRSDRSDRTPYPTPLPALAAAVAMAHPGWGANFGGALTAVVAAATVLWSMRERRRRRLALCVAGALVVAVAGIAALDSLRPPARQSHLGRLVGEVRAQGAAPLRQIVAGKLATNLRIAGGYWGLLLACEVGACLWVAARRRRSATATVPAGDDTRLSTGARGVPFLPPALAALLFNDSGVIAAALMLSLVPALWAAKAPEDGAGQDLGDQGGEEHPEL